MTTAQANKIATAILHDDSCPIYNYYGIRFGDEIRAIGDRCDNSRDNRDREDEREFPAWGTPEYDELPEFDGTCAYDARYIDDILAPDGSNDYFESDHLYIIAGDSIGDDNGGDDYEIVIRDAIIIGIVF